MMRRLSMIALLLLAANTFAADWVDTTLRSMTLEQKVGQLLLPYAPEGGFRGAGSDEFQALRNDLTTYHLGGYHVRKGDPVAVALLINDLQKASRIPLLITADLEGGTGYVMPGATRLPLGMGIGATGSEELAAAAGRITAIEGRAMGIGVQFYPVVDVQNNPRNPIINIRSFGEEPSKVASLAAAYLRAVQENGMLATAKHFPGHGDVDTDSHLVLPTLDADRTRLDAVELPPFRAAIDAGVAAIMTAHIYLPKLDEEKNLPATLSKNVLTTLLRDELRFGGLVISDALDMGGVTTTFDEKEAVIRTVEAGSDIVLFPVHLDVAFNALVEAVKSGRISESRIDSSVRRILAAKKRLGLDKYKPADLNALSNVLGTKESRDIARNIQEQAITLVRDERNALPLRPSADLRVLHVTIIDNQKGWREGPVGVTGAAELLKRFPRAVHVAVDDRSTPGEYEMIRRTADLVDAVIVSGFIRVGAFKGSIDFDRQQLALLRSLSQLQKPFVFTLFGSPFLLHAVPELPSYILTYDTHAEAERVAVRAITGEIPFRGKLPVSLPGLYPLGHGLTR